MTKGDHELVEKYKKHYVHNHQKVGLRDELARNVKQIYWILDQLKTHGVVDEDFVKTKEKPNTYDAVEFIEHLQQSLCQLDLLAKWKQGEEIKAMHDEAGLNEDGFPKKLGLH